MLGTETGTSEFMPVDHFTLEELRLIVSAVNKYINSESTDPIRDSILTKANAATIRQLLVTDKLARNLFRLNSRPEVCVSMNNPTDIPVIKFVSCPTVINTSFIGRHSLADYYAHEFEYLNHWINIKTLRDDIDSQKITLDVCEVELLLSFYIYHSLCERGCLQDGVLSETSSEGESEG